MGVLVRRTFCAPTDRLCLHSTVTIMISFVLLVLAQLPGATARLFTVVNTCPFTIWHVYCSLPFYETPRCVLTRGLLLIAGPPYVPPPQFRCTHDSNPYTPQIYTDLSVAQNVPAFPTGYVQLRIPSHAAHLVAHSRHLHPVCVCVGGNRLPQLPSSSAFQTTGRLGASGSAPFPSPLNLILLLIKRKNSHVLLLGPP